jgi:hypothetical protein
MIVINNTYRGYFTGIRNKRPSRIKLVSQSPCLVRACLTFSENAVYQLYRSAILTLFSRFAVKNLRRQSIANRRLNNAPQD